VGSVTDPFTGGDVTNSMHVTVIYTIVDV